MKKRILTIIFVVTLLATSLAALAACDEKPADDLNLVYNKKYIYQKEVRFEEKEQQYYIFQEDGTCTFHFYQKKTSTSSGNIVELEYIVHYRYAFADNSKSAIVYFYDSVDDQSSYTTPDGVTTKFSTLTEEELNSIYPYKYLPNESASRLLTVSKDILSYVEYSGYIFYINEDFIDSIPNYKPYNSAN